MRVISDEQSIVANVLDHATYHRGQRKTLIKLAGGTAVDCGQLDWSRLHGESTEL